MGVLRTPYGCIVLLFVAVVAQNTELPLTTLPDSESSIISTTLLPTGDFVPTKPLNLTVRGATSTSLSLTWIKPENANGGIEGYRLYYMHGNFTDVKTLKQKNNTPINTRAHIVLLNLRPYTNYTVWVKAFTWKNEGDPSDSVFHATDVSGPSQPRILNVSCKNPETLQIKWARPYEFYHSIDYYYIYYRNLDTKEFQEIPIETSSKHLDITTIIPNLTLDTTYEIKIRGASRSTFNKDQLIRGPYSESHRMLMHSTCDRPEYQLISSELRAGIIAGVVCAAFAIILGVSSFVMWRRCFHTEYYYLDDPPSQAPPTLMDWEEPPAAPPTLPGDAIDFRIAIAVDAFQKHVADLHADGDIGFSKEYEAIQAESTQEEYASQHSLHPENKAKNRYLNIIAYDHTRVHLLPVPGQKKAIDYVNANYIDGFQCSRAYIGTQGPLPSTFDCFWRMVWEQRVVIIVMITNLVERGRRKCDMYWPSEGTETYGVIQVKLLKEDVMATYTVRTLQIKHLRIKKKKSSLSEKLVYQYHYTNWPDHGTPDHPLPVLNFVKKSAAANPANAGPIIVHCSAGVGRTGTYIVLDAMLKQIKQKGVVNIFGFLRHIRTQRNFLVQTEEQYIFIHDALLEAIESGETNVSKSHMETYICALRADEDKQPWALLSSQFKLMTSFQTKDFNLVSANKTANNYKNRPGCVLPVESSRVHLTPKPGVDGSDYINATWLQGFQKLREFIITQHPLPATLLDFWQMVWDHNVQTIVMLSMVDSQEFGIFWPTDTAFIEAPNYRVKFMVEQSQPGCVSRDFVIQSLQDDYELNVRLLQCSNWPHFCEPLSTVFDLPIIVQQHHAKHMNGPIVVIDKFGGTEAASFCCLTSLGMQLEYENYADVYMFAKLYHNKRPGIWKNTKDYLLLYRAIEAVSPNMKILPEKPLPNPVVKDAPPDLYQMASANGSINGFRSINGSVREPAAEGVLVERELVETTVKLTGSPA